MLSLISTKLHFFLFLLLSGTLCVCWVHSQPFSKLQVICLLTGNAVTVRICDFLHLDYYLIRSDITKINLSSMQHIASRIPLSQYCYLKCQDILAYARSLHWKGSSCGLSLDSHLPLALYYLGWVRLTSGRLVSNSKLLHYPDCYSLS